MKLLRHIILTAAILAVAVAAHPQSAEALEGNWAIDGGPVFSFSPMADGTYQIVIVDSPDLRIAPGTGAGTARRIDRDRFRIDMSLKARDSEHIAPTIRFDAKLTLTPEGGASMTLRPVRPFRADVWLRYCLLFSATVRAERPADSYFAERIEPKAPPSAHNPLIL